LQSGEIKWTWQEHSSFQCRTNNSSHQVSAIKIAMPQAWRPTVSRRGTPSQIRTSDLAIAISGTYAYADDLAIMHADIVWQAVEGVLSKDV